MAGWKNACVGLALSLILLGVCCDASDEGQAGEESKPNQGVFYQQGPPLQRFPPRPPPNWIPFYPPPRPPPRQFPRPPLRRPPAPPRRAAPFDITSFITYYYLIRAFIATPAPPTTTPALKIVPVCTGSWGAWGECSAKCAGTQSRKHPCTGAMEYRPCNGPGVQSNGWYRASNCYEYMLSSVTANKADAATACGNLGSAQLASVGMRNTTVRTEIHQALFNNVMNTIRFFIGLQRTAMVWTWDDGSTETPNLWDNGEPDAQNCVLMTLGNPQSGEDFNCASAANYLCERKIT